MCLQFCFIVSVIVTLATATSLPTHGCSGENFVYDPCPKCRLLACEDLTKPPVCNQNAKCVPTCRCADGYLISYNQKCVKMGDCLKCTGPNEFFSCGIPCDRACNNLNVDCEASEVCTERCYCKNGFARNENDVCIPIKKCKLPSCEDPNAVYHICKTCPRTCRKPNGGLCSSGCIAGCSCKDGYVRFSNTNSTCVTLSQCRKHCQPNEYYDCGNPCDRSCKNLEASCSQSISGCVNRCYCIDDYARDDKGVCIPIDNCEFPKCDDPNAEYLRCRKCVGTCENREISCSAESCSPGCSCKEGYVRTSNKNNTCIKESLCKDKRCPGKYEYYSSCVTTCPRRCNTQYGGTACTASASSCQPGCQCISGYMLYNNSCIAPEDCPPFVCDARPNEIYSKCGEKNTQTCASVLKLEPPISRDKTICDGTCICKKGYVRSGWDRCVLQKFCGTCKNPFEEYSDCGPVIESSCQVPNPEYSSTCKAGCFCRLGYIRNFKRCIPIEECPPIEEPESQ